MNGLIDERVQATLDYGRVLAESQKWEGFVDGIDEDVVRFQTAILLENMDRFLTNMDESTKIANIGNFDKFALGMIRQIFPSLAALDLFSVQPMLGPVGLVFYLKFLYGKTKGRVVGGSTVFETAGATYYSSEIVDGENIGTGDASATVLVASLSELPVKAGTVVITTANAAGTTLTATDNGAGGFSGDVSAGSIDYRTGSLTVTWTSAPGNGTAILATYEYDMEMSSNIPEIDLALTSSPVEAKPRKLRARWSVEAQQDLKNVHGVDAELELVSALGHEIKFEIDLELAKMAETVAYNSITWGLAPWDRKTPTAVSWNDHKQSLFDYLVALDDVLFRLTGRSHVTWFMCGSEVTNIISTLPGFVAVTPPPRSRGVHLLGRLNGMWDIYKNANMDGFTGTVPGSTLSTITGARMIVGGFKGDSFLEAGIVFAPYIMLYTTPTIGLDDFAQRKGMASRYGKKVVEQKFYIKGGIIHS